ncbi:carboxypeptidase-like regulatory domain-containing protein [Sunxiuqinia sp. A32]|uniref:carboxypeptidase-like regulatory domain-containing protein n=1 Tax=Sunxiuqinia sp. A32 TaxID=3461496 RepID=UPI0040453CE2
MKTLSIYFAIFLFSCMVSTAGNGQTTNIWGKVVDKETMQPLIGVNISLENNLNGIGTITNQEGEFRLWNLPHDTANILISLDGYQTSLVDVSSLNGSHSEIKVIKLDTANNSEKEPIAANKKLPFLKKKSQVRK